MQESRRSSAGADENAKRPKIKSDAAYDQTMLAKLDRSSDVPQESLSFEEQDFDTAFEAIKLTEAERAEFNQDDIDRIFDPAGWDSAKIPDVIEAETAPRVANIEKMAATIPSAEVLQARAAEALQQNSQELRQVSKEESEDIRALLNGVLATSGNFEDKSARLADIAGLYPKETLEAIRDFGLSHDEIVSFAEAVPANQRGRLFEALGVPLIKKDGPQKSPEALVEAIESVERAKGKELVRKFEHVSRELTLAIGEEFPERAASDADIHAKEKILQGKILAVRELGAAVGDAVTSPLLLDIQDSTMPAICKPQNRETPLVNGVKVLIRNGIEAGGMAKREALVSLINRALGYDMVPTTVLREGPEGVSSVQEWTTGQIPRNRPDEEGGWEAAQDREQLRRIGFIDHLVARSDGHTGNWIVGFDGKAKMIDNGSAFAKQTNPLDRMYSVPLMEVKGDKVPADMKEGAARFLATFKTKEALRQGFHGLLGLTDGEQFWQEFIGRLEDATKEEFTLPDTGVTYQQALAFCETGIDFSREDAEEYVRQSEAKTDEYNRNNP